MANLKVSENPLPFLPFTETVDPSNPVAGGQRLFVDTDHLLKLIDSSGTVQTFTSGGMTDPMTTRGDIIYRNASNATARLARGSANQVLTSDGTDIAWAAPASAGMATDALWDAAGDLAVGTGANTGAKLTAGSDRRLLQIASGTPAWGLPKLWGCIISGTSTALGTGAYTSLAFGSADTYDPDAFHDPASSNTLITIPTGLGGYYHLTIIARWPSGSSTDRRMAYRINGGTDVGDQRFNWSISSVINDHTYHILIPTLLAAGDTVECRMLTNLSSTTTTSYRAALILAGVA